MFEDDHLFRRRFEQLEPFVGQDGAASGLVLADHHEDRHIQARHVAAKVDILKLGVEDGEGVEKARSPLIRSISEFSGTNRLDGISLLVSSSG